MYLYEKIGEIQKCIGSYIKILEQLFWEYIDIYENTQEKDKELNLQGQRQ